MAKLMLHPDRLFSADPGERAIARELYASVRDLPIVSPHGHTDPAWFAADEAFPNPAELLIVPDHYVFRMLYSQGVPLEALGVPSADGTPVEQDGREIWRRFATNFHLFRGTPSELWLNWVFAECFAIDVALDPGTADHYYDRIAERLDTPEFRPRALYERFGIEVLATTEGAVDELPHHRALGDDSWTGRVISTYRPDSVVDPDYEGFHEDLERLGELSGEDVMNWRGYLAAHRERRAYFREVGKATATDHGHPSARTANLSTREAERLFARIVGRRLQDGDAELFRAQMLTEMARMSLDDGMVMQIHPGSRRNHNREVFDRFGRDKGADIPGPTDYVEALGPLLDNFGNEAGLTIIAFTLDEDSYSRELAPLAGHYPALRLGPPWWFHDSPEGMRRYRERVTETAGFYNTAGFNDDTRAFLSIPARHDVARRMDCAWLAKLVAEHRLAEDAAAELAGELAYGLAKRAYRL